MFRIRFMLLALPLIAIFSSCATTGGGGKPASNKPVVLEFKGKPGETSETRYFSNARILSYQDRQLLRDRTLRQSEADGHLGSREAHAPRWQLRRWHG